jgi:hypothetical protein
VSMNVLFLFCFLNVVFVLVLLIPSCVFGKVSDLAWFQQEVQ